MTILDEIVAAKRREVVAARRRMPFVELEAQAAEAPPVRDFPRPWPGPGPIQLIAEVKKASPSARSIRADFDPVAIARTYQEHGAACISVLTDEPFFQGHLSYLARVRASVAIPLLRKDFLIDEYQVVEARLAGADAILLIAEILDDATMAALLERARALGMPALVELHDAVNLPRVLDAGADLVGINNRDLRQFTTDIEHTLDSATRSRPGSCWSAKAASAPARRGAARGRRRLGHSGGRIADARPRHRPGRRAALGPGPGRASTTSPDGLKSPPAAAGRESSRWTRMKWSVKGEWGITFLTVGMWHEMQPVAGLTGQIGAARLRPGRSPATAPCGLRPSSLAARVARQALGLVMGRRGRRRCDAGRGRSRSRACPCSRCSSGSRSASSPGSGPTGIVWRDGLAARAVALGADLHHARAGGQAGRAIARSGNLAATARTWFPPGPWHFSQPIA